MHCPKCDEPVNRTCKYCPSCGLPLADDAVLPPDGADATVMDVRPPLAAVVADRTRWPIYAGVGTAALVTLVGILVLVGRGPHRPGSQSTSLRAGASTSGLYGSPAGPGGPVPDDNWRVTRPALPGSERQYVPPPPRSPVPPAASAAMGPPIWMAERPESVPPEVLIYRRPPRDAAPSARAARDEPSPPSGFPGFAPPATPVPPVEPAPAPDAAPDEAASAASTGPEAPVGTLGSGAPAAAPPPEAPAATENRTASLPRVPGGVFAPPRPNYYGGGGGYPRTGYPGTGYFGNGYPGFGNPLYNGGFGNPLYGMNGGFGNPLYGAAGGGGLTLGPPVPLIFRGLGRR
jgi:hypothetical protein